MQHEKSQPAEIPLPSDQEVFVRMARGEEGALAILYDRYASVSLSLAARIMGDRVEAEDAVQNAFVRLWRDSARYDASLGTVSAWLLSSVRHAAIDRRRRRASQIQRVRDVASLAEPASESPSGGEERQRLRCAVEALPRDQREVLELAYFDGLSQSEIAAKLGQPLGTVKTRVRLGMDKLRLAFQRMTGESR